MSAPTDEELTQWLDRESHWPKGQRDIVRAVRREIDSLRAENAKLRTQLANALAAPTSADRAEARRLRGALERVCEAWGKRKRVGSPPSLSAVEHAVSVARDVLEEAPREQPKQVLPEAVERLRATQGYISGCSPFTVDDHGPQSEEEYFSAKEAHAIVDYLRTARLGEQPAERERRAVELLESVVQLAREGAFGVMFMRRADLAQGDGAGDEERACDVSCDCVICEAERLLAEPAP